MPNNTYSGSASNLVQVSLDVGIRQDLTKLSFEQQTHLREFFRLCTQSEALQDKLLSRMKRTSKEPFFNVQGVEFAFRALDNRFSVFRIRFLDNRLKLNDFRLIYVYDYKHQPQREIRFLAVVRKGTEEGQWNYEFTSQIGQRILAAINQFAD
jgi:hypothetical protein